MFIHTCIYIIHILIHIESICLYICKHVILIMNILVHAYDEYLYMYTYIYIYIHIYRYLCTERERERRDRETYWFAALWTVVKVADREAQSRWKAVWLRPTHCRRGTEAGLYRVTYIDIYIYICVCMCICNIYIYVEICIYIYIYLYTWISFWSNVCHMYIHIFTSMSKHIYIERERKRKREKER